MAFPRDGDGDGFIYDGTPRQRPAPPRPGVDYPTGILAPRIERELAAMLDSDLPADRGIAKGLFRMTERHPEVAKNLFAVDMVSVHQMGQQAGRSGVGGMAMARFPGWSISFSPTNLRDHFNNRHADHSHVSTKAVASAKGRRTPDELFEVYTEVVAMHEFAHLMHMHSVAVIWNQHLKQRGLPDTAQARRDMMLSAHAEVSRGALDRWKRRHPDSPENPRLERMTEVFGDVPKVSRYADQNFAERVAEWMTAAELGAVDGPKPYEPLLAVPLSFDAKTGSVVMKVSDLRKEDPFVARCTFEEESMADLLTDAADEIVKGMPMGRDMYVPAPLGSRRKKKRKRPKQVEVAMAKRDVSKKFNTISPGGRPADDSSLDRSPKKNWVEQRGGLPRYIRMVANAMMRKGRPRSLAIRLAIGIVRNWATHQNVSPKVKAAAIKAIAEWEAMKKGEKIAKSDTWQPNLGDHVAMMRQLREDGVI